MDAGVEFLGCDQPFASRLTLHILAAVAEDEARRISERTKAALQAAKARGRKLGSPVAAKTVARARAAPSAYAAKANATTLAVIRKMQGSGVETLAGSRWHYGPGALRHLQGAVSGSLYRCPCF